MKALHACGDCLEEAGGRQKKHSITWHVDICASCGRHTSVTDCANFGSPRLLLKILPLPQPEEA